MSDIILALRNATEALCRRGRDRETSISNSARGEIHALVGENGAGKSTLDQSDGRRRTLTSGHDAGRRR